MCAEFLGVEMSSDEDTTPSLEKDTIKTKKTTGLRRRFKLFKQKHSSPKEGTIGTSDLQDIYAVTSDIQRPLATDFNEDVESGVDALEEDNLMQSNVLEDEKGILNEIAEHVDNIEVDDEEVLNVREVSGCDIRNKSNGEEKSVTVFAPVGFVDMRDYAERKSPNY